MNTLEQKLADFTTLTAGLDMSRFHLMDFGTRRRFSRDVQEAIVKRLQQESGLSVPVITIWHVVCRSHRWVPGA